MKCPFCGNKNNKVVDSRESLEGASIRRRRECLKCKRRFTTYEHVEEMPLMVIKKDGRREPYDRKKISSGLIKAFEKRPISMEKIEEIVENIERQVMRKFDKEVPSQDIGEFVMEKLAKLDEIAYVRFASVYRQFKDVSQFMKELKIILDKQG
ncbi:MAG: transcriptional regulator NrdR [Candidatus Omnitrophica bacterium]|nr:transcriptional regulator NrdR [Candidatus Omnitrophota bacterium]HOX54143.1 transcriptional regulator NrdR [Candidatus Omnitrophota bacterium]